MRFLFVGRLVEEEKGFPSPIPQENKEGGGGGGGGGGEEVKSKEVKAKSEGMRDIAVLFEGVFESGPIAWAVLAHHQSKRFIALEQRRTQLRQAIKTLVAQGSILTAHRTWLRLRALDSWEASALANRKRPHHHPDHTHHKSNTHNSKGHLSKKKERMRQQRERERVDWLKKVDEGMEYSLAYVTCRHRPGAGGGGGGGGGGGEAAKQKPQLQQLVVQQQQQQQEGNKDGSSNGRNGKESRLFSLPLDMTPEDRPLLCAGELRMLGGAAEGLHHFINMSEVVQLLLATGKGSLGGQSSHINIRLVESHIFCMLRNLSNTLRDHPPARFEGAIRTMIAMLTSVISPMSAKLATASSRKGQTGTRFEPSLCPPDALEVLFAIRRQAFTIMKSVEVDQHRCLPSVASSLEAVYSSLPATQ